jgi:hypothetical protein
MRRYIGIAIVCLFFGVVLGAALVRNSNFPIYAFAGESSAGTWLSGALLTICAAVCIVLGMRENGWQWFGIAVFFLLLAADEHFMLHEQLKEHLIFTDHTRSRSVYELPVLGGAAIGLVVSFVLWKLLQGSGRYLLLTAIGFGAVSVAMDVLTAGVLWEDACKLLGELAITCALLLRSYTQSHRSHRV